MRALSSEIGCSFVCLSAFRFITYCMHISVSYMCVNMPNTYVCVCVNNVSASGEWPPALIFRAHQIFNSTLRQTLGSRFPVRTRWIEYARRELEPFTGRGSAQHIKPALTKPNVASAYKWDNHHLLCIFGHPHRDRDDMNRNDTDKQWRTN